MKEMSAAIQFALLFLGKFGLVLLLLLVMVVDQSLEVLGLLLAVDLHLLGHSVADTTLTLDASLGDETLDLRSLVVLLAILLGLTTNDVVLDLIILVQTPHSADLGGT